MNVFAREENQVDFAKSFAKTWLPSDPYSEPCQTSKMKRFAKIVKGFYPLPISTKRSILAVWQGSKHASEHLNEWYIP